MKKKLCVITILAFLLLTISGCGSVENSTPGTFVSKSVLSGTVSPLVLGVQITLILPDGVTVEIDPVTGKPLVTALAPNDVATSGGLLDAEYVHADGTTPGQVKIAIIRGDTSKPFTAGDFFSVVCVVAAGQAVPSSSAFSFSGLKIWDADGNDITSSSGATATVSL